VVIVTSNAPGDDEGVTVEIPIGPDFPLRLKRFLEAQYTDWAKRKA
jgi:hypothetical protein